jgi:peptidoglycan hydrolase-like protein with peptidoglycan-binding domain
MWFDLDLFGARKKRLRELDTAILLASRLFDSLNGSLAGANPPVPISGATAFMTAVQVRSLLELAGDDLRDALRREGSPFKPAFDIAPQWTDSKVLADALKALQNLLEGRRNGLRAQGSAAPAQPAVAVGVPTNAGDANAANPAGPVRPDEAAVLWGVTDRLYASWHVRGIVLLVAIAIAIAAGGSFVIGSQTLNVRKSLDDAQEKAQTEIRAISAATQTRVSDESKDVITSLRERGRDIEKQLQRAEKGVSDLNAGSDKIKLDIVEKLQNDLKGRENGLREEILGPLAKIRDDDIKTISTTLTGVRKTLGEVDKGAKEESDKLTLLGPKLGRLQSYADQSEKIVTALTAITADQSATTNARASAETEANTAILQKKIAESAAADAIERRNQAITVVKGASEEAQKHNRTLALIEQQLKDFDSRLKRLDEKLNADVAVEEARLKSIRDRIAVVENPPKPPTPPTPPAPPVPPEKTHDSLTSDDWKQIQSRLDVKPDGKYGKKTATAIRAYQRGIKAKVTGRLTPEQIAVLLKPKA